MATRKLSRSRQRQDPPTLGFELFTPEQAYELLSTLNPLDERKLRERMVQKYARDMRDGNWLMAGEPILIDAEGNLAGNGQHRLYAVIEADVEVELPVMRNATAEEKIIVDQGIRRSFADVLRIQFHETDTVALAAAVRQLRQYRETGILGVTGTAPTANPTIAELVDTYRREPNLKNSLSAAMRSIKMANLQISRGMMATLHYLFNEIDPENADAFFERIADGHMLTKNDPIMHIRRYFVGPDRPRTVKVQSAVIIKAFNLWRLGEKPQTLRWRGGGKNPERYPKIDPGAGAPPVEPVNPDELEEE